jgi:hypothetical protein
MVESALGSQPIWMTLFPMEAKAAARLDVTVDLPIPPFPYIATFSMVFSLYFPIYNSTKALIAGTLWNASSFCISANKKLFSEEKSLDGIHKFRPGCCRPGFRHNANSLRSSVRS